MKKIIMIMCLLFSMGISNVLGQEVRGVETKRIKYNGSSQYNCGGYETDEYYGWEFHNANGIAVSVDIELWRKVEYRNGGAIIKHEPILQMTKSVVLNPSEKYIFKFEGYTASHCCAGNDIESFYIKYRAFKLQ